MTHLILKVPTFAILASDQIQELWIGVSSRTGFDTAG